MEAQQKTQRLLYIDNLRGAMIILVVLVHAAVTYSGFGSSGFGHWNYYIENMGVDMGSTLFFVFFQSFTQAYFMALLFFVAGYFARESILKKGPKLYVMDRLKRLGIPILVYMFLLHPICVKLASPGLNIMDQYFIGLKNFSFFSWTGPLWFAITLLFFSLLFALLFKTRPIKHQVNFRPFTIICAILIITFCAFSLRFVFPIGVTFMNLQLGNFAAYIVLFISGIQAHHLRLFENNRLTMNCNWLKLSLGIGIPFWILIFIVGGAIKEISLIEGGLKWQSFAFALWEAFFCVTFSIALLLLFKKRFNTQTRLQKFITENAFAVFIFHAPILISVTILCRIMIIPPVLKFLFTGCIALTLTFLFAFAIRKVSFLKRIFS